MTSQSVNTAAVPLDVPWYRRNGWVTAMVAGILLIGPILALPVLVILSTGSVYSQRGTKRWDASTKGLVFVFSLFVMGIWCYQAYQALFGEFPDTSG